MSWLQIVTMLIGACISAVSNAVGTLMGKLVDYVLELIKHHFRYLFCLEKIVEELEEQKENLIKEQIRVQEDVREAKRHIQTQVIEQYVENWLTEAENVLKEAESLECSRIEENERCFRWCPNWSWRYQLSRKMEQKTLSIRKLVESCKFDRIGHRATLPDIEFLSSKDLTLSKSSTSAFNQIIKALKGDEVSLIGVWGMGGVGKTTLVTEVGNKVKDFPLFDRVIKVVVSQAPDVGKIQDKIRDSLDFNFGSTIQEGKARELWARLKKEEKVLIILDDMWKELNLEKIGIPFGENHNGCKIILTTRRKQVCEDMESQVTISLGVLDEEEAWTLFEKKASLEDASPDIIGVAKVVAKECGGLPIAIVTLARALRRRVLNGWKVARRKLERSRLIDIELVPKEVDQNAYLCLEMSYKYLESEPTKRCFLLCALYPEDYSIDVEDLVRYAWALRFYQDADSIEDVRSEVFETIDILKDSCLLSEDDDEKRNIKMHDVVRDVALWIAAKEDNGLVAKSGSENESSKQKLEILLLDEYDWKTPKEDFEGMPELKVLSLLKKESYDGSVFSFNAIKSLKNLRALHLKRFGMLEGISALAKLTKLEILSLRGSKFQEPMDNIGELTNLRVLDMSHCHFLFGVRPSLIRRLVRVEELYLNGPTIRRSVNGAFLLELNSLPRLASLFLEVSFRSFPKDYVFPELKEYNIIINEDGPIIDWREKSSKLLTISEGLPLNVISKLLCNVEFLGVSGVKEKDIKFLTDTTLGNVPVATILRNLEGVVFQYCNNLEVIFQMKKAENDAFEKFRCLSLCSLPSLEYIWKIPTQHIRLRSLEVVKIAGCRKLKSLFSFSLAQSLECLEKLDICDCDELKQIVEESEGDEQEISQNINPDKPLRLPKLRDLSIFRCFSLEYIFPNFMAPDGLPQLQRLSLEDLSQLKQICGPAKQREENGLLLPQQLQLPSLTDLSLRYCGKLTNAAIHSESILADSKFLEGVQLSQLIQTGFVVNAKKIRLRGIGDSNLIPEVCPEGLNELSVLERHSCKSLEYLVDTTKEHVPNSAFSNLVELSLEQMGGLKRLCNGQFPKGFLQNLKELRIYECPRLEYVLQITLAQGLPQLEKLDIGGRVGDVLGRAIESNSNLHVAKQHDGGEHRIKLPCLKDLQLYFLRNLSSFGPENYFLEAPALEHICVCACPQLMKFTIQQEVNSRVDLREVRLSAFKEILRNANNLTLKRIMDLQKNLIPDVDVDLQQLTSLSLEDCEDLECLANTADEEHVPTSEVFTNLVELTMIDMNGLKVLWNGQPPRGFLQNLKSLTVENCKKLEEIFGIDELLCNTEQNQAPLLSNLDSLKIESAPELRWIVKGPTQYVNLRRLKRVSIYECNKLEFLFSSSLTPSLRLLEDLSVILCDELKMVFTEDETESNTLCMPNLKSLEIFDCPTLKYVLTNLSSVTDCPENCFIKAPALKELKVSGCPRLSNFTFQQHKQLQPKDFEERIDEAELCNNQLRERSPNMMNFDQLFLPSTRDNFMSNLEEVELSDLDWLRYIWKAPTQVVVTNLKELVIYNCNRLAYVFPAMLVRYLRQLWNLEIRCCEKLAQIIVNDDTSASSSQGHDEDETGAKNKKEMLIFPQLGKLLLKELPSLLRFSPVGYHLIFPSLDSLEIRGCSQMITSFTADSIQSVHATEAPRLDDATPSTRVMRWTWKTWNYWSEAWDEDEEVDASLPPYMEEAEEL